MSASLEQLLRDARIDLILSRIEKDSSVIDEVIEQVDNDIRSIRFNSIFVLGELGEKSGRRAVSKIKTYLKDNDWSIRRECARSLGKIGPIADEA
ncbi:MAG: HEAT repeat domain-containing protein, partial [Candidatus Hermodarchaeota archaeon]